MIKIANLTVEKVKTILSCNEGIVSAGPTSLDDITLFRGVTLHQFRKWDSKSEEKRWGVKVEFMDGRIIATELAGRAHAFVVGKLIKMLSAQDPNDDLEYGVKEDVDFISGEQYRADVTVNVRGNYIGPTPGLVNLNGGYFPVVIVEIGISQTLPDLCQKLVLYSTIPSIQIYIAIKRYVTNGIVALRFDRANMWEPVSIISFGMQPLHPRVMRYIQKRWPIQGLIGVGFGGPPCNVEGLSPYIISLPSALIFSGCEGGVPTGAPVVYDIDLFKLQSFLML